MSRLARGQQGWASWASAWWPGKEQQGLQRTESLHHLYLSYHSGNQTNCAAAEEKVSLAAMIGCSAEICTAMNTSGS